MCRFGDFKRFFGCFLSLRQKAYSSLCANNFKGTLSLANFLTKNLKQHFLGITGNVSIDNNGDRYSDYSLLDLDPDMDKFIEVAYYSGSSNELKQMGPFHWVGGKPPKDSPICGYDHSKCPEGYPLHVYALGCAAILIILLAFGFFFFYRRYKLEAELAAMSWRIRWDELDGDELKKEKRKNQKRARKSVSKLHKFRD